MQNKIEEQLDRIFSVYIRLKYADHAGFVSCFTCTIRRKWQEMDAGHFISRSNKSTRWDEENVFPQCIEDNRFYGSKHDVFEEVLRDILGEDGFSELLKRSRLPPPSDDQMRKLIIHYTLLVKKMGKVIIYKSRTRLLHCHRYSTTEKPPVSRRFGLLWSYPQVSF